jgi:hypothetical protein
MLRHAGNNVDSVSEAGKKHSPQTFPFRIATLQKSKWTRPERDVAMNAPVAVLAGDRQPLGCGPPIGTTA